MADEKQETMVLVTEKGIMVGACVHYPVLGGWKFIPHTTSRKSSRKTWPSASACIPVWAFERSDDMLTASEFAEMQAQKVAA